VLSGRGLCDELNTRPKDSYRRLCVVVCGLENKSLVNEEEGKGPLGGSLHMSASIEVCIASKGVMSP